MRRSVLSYALLFALGCGGNPVKKSMPPAGTGVEQYIAALRSDDPAKAYSLLSSEVKQELPFEEFAIQWRESAAERKDQALALEEGLRGRRDLGERAKLVYGNGKTVYLARQNGRWRLDTAVVARVHAGRPHDAVAIFAEALDKRDYEAILRVLTQRRRDGIGQEVDRFVKSLLEYIQSDRSAIETIGKDRAEMRWDDGKRSYRIVLRKEGDEWRIDDVHLRPAPETPDQE